MKILIGADIVPTKINMDYFCSGAIDKIICEDLMALLNKADMRIFNLETPITDKLSPIMKEGPALIAPSASLNAIKKLQPDILAIGNNHILDQGEDGLYSTLNHLKDYQISAIGAGSNTYEAGCPRFKEIDGVKIGFFACAEHEFSIATSKSPGANPFDPLETLDRIEAIKKECDYLIVLYHGGKEYYRYPTPNVQKVCRKMVDKGADLVVTQQSHCIGCKEVKDNGTIIYGQGNFIFNHYATQYEETSLLISIEIDPINKEVIVDYIPLEQTHYGVKLAQGIAGSEILENFYERSSMILNDNFVEEEYGMYSEQMITYYLEDLLGKVRRSLLFRVLNKLTGRKLANTLFDKNDQLKIMNNIRCESHRELIITGLTRLIERRL